MALQALGSHVTYAGNLLKAGDTFDDAGVEYAGLVDAGAQFFLASNSTIKAAIAAVTKARRRGANEIETDAIFASFVLNDLF